MSFFFLSKELNFFALLLCGRGNVHKSMSECIAAPQFSPTGGKDLGLDLAVKKKKKKKKDAEGVYGVAVD